MGVNTKFINFVFTPTQLIQNLQYDTIINKHVHLFRECFYICKQNDIKITMITIHSSV